LEEKLAVLKERLGYSRYLGHLGALFGCQFIAKLKRPFFAAQARSARLRFDYFLRLSETSITSHPPLKGFGAAPSALAWAS